MSPEAPSRWKMLLCRTPPTTHTDRHFAHATCIISGRPLISAPPKDMPSADRWHSLRRDLVPGVPPVSCGLPSQPRTLPAAALARHDGLTRGAGRHLHRHSNRGRHLLAPRPLSLSWPRQTGATLTGDITCRNNIARREDRVDIHPMLGRQAVSPKTFGEAEPPRRA